MKAIICAGGFFKGVVERNSVTGKDELVMYPGVHGIDTTKSLPSVDTILANRWYFYASNWHKDTPQGDKGSPFAQGNGGHVAIPYCLNDRTPYPLEWFQRWQSTILQGGEKRRMVRQHTHFPVRTRQDDNIHVAFEYRPVLRDNITMNRHNFLLFEWSD